MELKQYAGILWRWAWLILLGLVLAGGTGYVVSKLTTPVYRASATLLVNQASGVTPITDYTSLITSQQLVKTYVELLKKRPVLQSVVDDLQLGTTSEQLAKAVSVSSVRDTSMINISVEHDNPQLSAMIANQIVTAFIQQIQVAQQSRFASSEQNLTKQLDQLNRTIAAIQKDLDQARNASPRDSAEIVRLESALTQYQNSYSGLLKSYEDLRIARDRFSDNIQIVESAVTPDSPVRPQTLLNTLIASVVGTMLTIGVAFLIEYLDDTLKTPEDIATACGLANLGIIARYAGIGPKAHLAVADEPRSPTAEGFRRLRTNIQFAAVGRKLHSLLVTSPNQGDGKSFVAANLAISLAQAGRTVALLDADLRRSAIHRMFQVHNNVGLTNLLLEEDGKVETYWQNSAIENIKILTTGPLPPNPAELLASERMGIVLDKLKKLVDIVVVDTAPVLAVADPVELANRVDGVLLILETGSVRRDAARHSLNSLQQADANVIGTVLNKFPSRGRSGHYYYYDYDFTSAGEKQ